MATATGRKPNREIIQRREEISAEMAEAREALEIAYAKMRSLQRQCKHPNEVVTSHQGETCHHCYDCGRCP